MDVLPLKSIDYYNSIKKETNECINIYTIKHPKSPIINFWSNVLSNNSNKIVEIIYLQPYLEFKELSEESKFPVMFASKPLDSPEVLFSKPTMHYPNEIISFDLAKGDEHPMITEYICDIFNCYKGASIPLSLKLGSLVRHGHDMLIMRVNI